MTASTSPGRKLRDLIDAGDIVEMPGCSDPLSARIFERMGFKALTVGGWMTGASRLIPEPLLTINEQVDTARAISKAVAIPVRVDGHTGFGEPIHTMRAVELFEDAGLAGVHIGDQIFPKRASHHRGGSRVCDLDEFQRRLEYALKGRNDESFVIMARTDAGIAVGGSWKEAARRARAVKAMGIEVLLPSVRTAADLDRFRQEYPDDDLALEGSSDHNHELAAKDYREHGFRLVSYPQAAVVTQMAALMDLYRGLQTSGILVMDPDWAREVRTEIEGAQRMEEFWAIEDATVEADSKKHESRHIAGYEGIGQTGKAP